MDAPLQTRPMWDVCTRITNKKLERTNERAEGERKTPVQRTINRSILSHSQKPFVCHFYFFFFRIRFFFSSATFTLSICFISGWYLKFCLMFFGRNLIPCFVTSAGSKAVCLICWESISMFNKNNFKRHFSTEHANYAKNLLSCKSDVKVQRLCSNFTSRPSKNQQPKFAICCIKACQAEQVFLRWLMFSKAVRQKQLTYCTWTTKVSLKTAQLLCCTIGKTK